MKDIGCVLLIAAFVIVLIFAGAMALVARSCDEAWVSYQHQWTPFGACQVLIDGQWVPSKNVLVQP